MFLCLTSTSYGVYLYVVADPFACLADDSYMFLIGGSFSITRLLIFAYSGVQFCVRRRDFRRRRRNRMAFLVRILEANVVYQ